MLGLAHQLLTNEFGHPLGFGDVTDLVLGKEVLPFGHELLDESHERGGAFAGLRRNGEILHAGGHGRQTLFRGDALDRLLGGEQLGGDDFATRSVHLVHDDTWLGTLGRAAAVEQNADDVTVTGADFLAGFEHRENNLNAVNTGLGRLVEPVAQTRLRPVQTGGVDEDDLDLVLGQDAANGGARCIRTPRGDGHLGADHLVDEGGFADVRPTNNGAKTRIGHSNSWRSISTSSMRRPSMRTTLNRYGG